MKTIQKTISKSKYVLLALLVVFSVSCSTEDGEPGPQGPAGTNGADGADGNANVIISDWYDLTWTAPNTTMTYHDQVVPEITENLIEASVILSYVRSSATTYLLPAVWTNTSTIGSGVSLENIRIYCRSESNIIMPTDMQGRHIIIPANIGGRASLDFKNMSYEEVMDHFGLDY
ncbi:MAG TPA: collagen-like protein [Xanthomarina sp.]|nr:collagen-like protein [Xanthomarina sp.]